MPRKPKESKILIAVRVQKETDFASLVKGIIQKPDKETPENKTPEKVAEEDDQPNENKTEKTEKKAEKPIGKRNKNKENVPSCLYLNFYILKLCFVQQLLKKVFSLFDACTLFCLF